MNNKIKMLYFFFSVFSHFSAVTPARSYSFGAKTGMIFANGAAVRWCTGGRCVVVKNLAFRRCLSAWLSSA